MSNVIYVGRIGSEQNLVWNVALILIFWRNYATIFPAETVDILLRESKLFLKVNRGDTKTLDPKDITLQRRFGQILSHTYQSTRISCSYLHINIYSFQQSDQVIIQEFQAILMSKH